MGLSLKTDARMSADAYMTWYDDQPDGKRYELFDGLVYEMQSERLIHGEIKIRVAEIFRRQIRERALPCHALGDGMAVKVDDETIFEPDVVLRCGPKLPRNTTLIKDPMIVVEVASPSTRRIDAFQKFLRYFRNPSIIHYLIVIPTKESAFHHRRMADGQIVTRGYETGIIRFDPPGVELDLAEVWAEI